MLPCPEKHCRYATQKSERLEAHKANTGHGRDRGRKEFKGDRQFLKAPKKKN